MYRIILRRIQISPIAVRRHYWTQGDGPNYSKNMLMVGIGTVICAAVGVVSFLSHIVLHDIKKCLYLTNENNVTVKSESWDFLTVWEGRSRGRGFQAKQKSSRSVQINSFFLSSKVA